MKTLLSVSVIAAALLLFTGCADEDDHYNGHDGHSHRGNTTTTVTEETSVHQPVDSVTETRSVRSY